MVLRCFYDPRSHTGGLCCSLQSITHRSLLPWGQMQRAYTQSVLEENIHPHADTSNCDDCVSHQELHQQLLIESRNLRKTRNFYHKLIQQDRRNKGETVLKKPWWCVMWCHHQWRDVFVFLGSDTKLMTSKLKQQFDELREKVQFLHSVKKYLQVSKHI